MLEFAFMRLAVAASVATGASLGILGVYLVMRRVVFLGLVLANAATLGAAVAAAIGWSPEFVSLAAAVGAAAALGELDASNRISAESLMGWAYAAASSVTVLILSQVAGGSSDTMHLLFGNVLAVPATHVVGLTVLAAAVILGQLLFMPRFVLVTFDPEAAKIAGVYTRPWSLSLNLSIGVVASAAVHEIGALSTFALLSLPAMAALLLTASIRRAFIVAAGFGIIVPVLALAMSFYLDLPAGPACVALLAFAAGAAAIGKSTSGR
jgi:ABC-type Mn2+/Zn2+ transport system permease subunit